MRGESRGGLPSETGRLLRGRAFISTSAEIPLRAAIVKPGLLTCLECNSRGVREMVITGQNN